MSLRPNYVLRLLDAISQLLNVLLLNGDANESISGRAFRESVLQGNRHWWLAMKLIDTLAFWEPDHCRRAYETDLARARYLVGER